MIKFFTQISKHDTPIAGGKGASLGEMTQAGIPVPSGFVVLSEAFEDFIKITDLNIAINAELDKVDIKAIHTVESASELIQSLILSNDIPDNIKTGVLKSFDELGATLVAVRSSATSEDSADAAWAGQLDSFLNTNKDNLLENIKRCWASLFTPRAIFYRFEKGLHKEKISVAVVVQKMIQSEVSGIAFSVHPVTEDYNQIIIEAGFGLGEAIVSGAITPDSYVVDKRDYSIIDINVNEQSKVLHGVIGGGNEWKELGERGEEQALSEKEIIELSKIIMKIEEHYCFPCDIEWAKEKGEFFITQSRPITTLKNLNLKLNDTRKALEEMGWEKAVKREFDFFIFSVSLDVNHSFMKKEIGDCFGNILYRYENKCGTIYDSPSETKKVSKLLAEILSKNDNLLELILKKEKELSRKKIPSDPRRLLNFFMEVMFYNTIIPFRVLPIIEKDPKFKKHLSVFEKIRATGGMYPELYHYHLRPLIHRIAKQAGIEKTLWSLLSYEEVSDLIDGKNVIDIDSLEKRKDGCWLYVLNGEKNIYFGDLDIGKEELVTEPNTNLIRGNVANKGHAQGVVRIVNSIEQILKVKKGDILVSISTNPSLMPAIKKAAAIVTDEGGIISHAAIISREIGTPCVIGTKIATQVLRDGDLVEVDADAGVVQILKRAQSDEYFKFKFPGYRYFMVNRLVPTFKFNDFFLWEEIFGEYSPAGMHRTITKKSVFLEPGRQLFELLQNDDKKLKEEIFVLTNEVLRLAKKLQTFLYQDQLENRVSNLEDFFLEYEKTLNKALAFGYPLDHAIDEHVKANPEITDSLESPFSSFLAEEEYDLYKIFSQRYGAPELEKALKRHLAKYAWIKSDYQGENILTLDDLYAKKDQIILKRPVKTKSLKGKIPPPKDLAQWISLLIYLRDMRKKVSMLGVVLLDRYLKAECKKLKKDYTQARMLTIEEFEMKKNGRLPEYPEGRRERSTAAGHSLLAKEEWQKHPFNQAGEVEEKKVLSGIVANKGIIQGKARVIMGKHDFHKMQKDDVIVASMTRPEFMPILKKASAILTEQGGITCHAAIISREMGLPCIIGIENLTTIIRDDDFLEVDADKGVVRIMEK